MADLAGFRLLLSHDVRCLSPPPSAHDGAGALGRPPVVVSLACPGHGIVSVVVGVSPRWWRLRDGDGGSLSGHGGYYRGGPVRHGQQLLGPPLRLWFTFSGAYRSRRPL